MSSTCTFLNNKLYQYMLNFSLRTPDIINELYEQTGSMSQSQMQTSKEQLQFMQLLTKLIQAKKAIDVGVFTGQSSLAVALAMPEDGQIIACDINEDWTSIAKEFWQKAGVAHKIQLKIAPAEETLQALLDDNQSETFDFCFIDANKTGYTQYYELCLKLLRPNGLILVDNAFMNGEVIQSNPDNKSAIAVHKLNEHLLNDDRIDLSLLPMGDGLSMIRKK